MHSKIMVCVCVCGEGRGGGGGGGVKENGAGRGDAHVRTDAQIKFMYYPLAADNLLLSHIRLF